MQNKTSTRIPRMCQNCGTSFAVQPNVVARGGGKYCSWPCQCQGRIKRVAATCEICGSEFSVAIADSKRRPAKYCSYACRGIAHRKRAGAACDVCGAKFVLRPNEHKSRNYCTLDCAHIGHRARKDEWVKPLNDAQRAGLDVGRDWWRGKKAADEPRLARKIEALAATRRGMKMPAQSERLRRLYADHPEKHPCYVVAQKGHETGIERAMRLALTDAGITFTTQHHIGRYWVDFAIASHNLAIEVDGAYWHDAERDALRDKNIAGLGWTVVRFTEVRINADVATCVAEVLRLIE